MAEVANQSETAIANALVGRIPVRNLWLLMLYASDLYRTAGSARVALDDNPDDLPDTVARILAYAVARRLRRGLALGYQPRRDVLSRVRGRIDVLATTRRQLLERGLVACRYEELTTNTPRNRLVRAALLTIGSLVSDGALARQCRTLANTMREQGVTGAAPTRAQMSTERFGRHDGADREMVDAARLAFDLALPTEEAGAHALPLPDREGTWVRKLFERAVGGYYAVRLGPAGWNIRCNNALAWQRGMASPGVDAILPGMEADIILDDPLRSQRIVIDTKFTTIVTAGWHRDTTLRSGYLYQIYSYLRSQAGSGDPLADTACGVLLHPAVGAMVDEWVEIQGHVLRFATVDLTVSSREIGRQLLDLCRVPGPAYTSPVR